MMNDKRTDKPDDSDEDKLLVSFYLSPKTLEKIDDFLFYARKQLPIGKRRKLTKSVFYETGLRIVIEDYNVNGEESPLWQAIQELLQN